MQTFFKRLGNALLDIFTSKKAIATGAAIVAKAAGADDVTVAAISAYVIGQGIADHGKEGIKAANRANKQGDR